LAELPSRIDAINIALEEFSKVFYPDGFNSPSAVQMFINLIGKDSSVEIHNDDWDVCFVHLLGEAKWTIHKSLNDIEPIQTFNVEPGDVLLIPKGVYHSIHAKTPRFGASLGFPDKSSSKSKHDKS
jgi:ribosomal protein L16 Arg81 hydroxylase